jgi:hypothetical protein
MKKVRVADSTTHGKGVFATTDFDVGDEILQIDDSHDVTRERELGLRKEEEVDYCDYLAGGKIVLMQPPERHINHSCDPNAYVKTIDGIRRVLARRRISEGEEVTYDYSINSRGDVTWNCNCGARRCRKNVHSDYFRLPIEIECEYLPLLDEWFIEEHEKMVKELAAECRSFRATD